jgi:hypothetical protein
MLAHKRLGMKNEYLCAREREREREKIHQVAEFNKTCILGQHAPTRASLLREAAKAVPSSDSTSTSEVKIDLYCVFLFLRNMTLIVKIVIGSCNTKQWSCHNDQYHSHTQ